MANAGIPKDAKLFSLEAYKGLNTKAKRPGIDDEEFSWVENFFPIGDSNLRTLYGPSAATYTASGQTIPYFYMFNIAATNYIFVLLSNGSAYAINAATGASTTIAPAATFTLTACAQWGNLYLLIVDKSNGYFIWDGTTLYSPGGAAPSGIYGGGSMPTGLNGTYIETFQSRVWIVNAAAVTYSAPASVSNFGTGSGGGSFSSTDSFLRTAFFAIKQSSGFLYLFGDSSINVISNVQTTGTSTPTTTFNNSNSDPQTGTSWPNTLQAFGRALVFANQSGVYALYGSSAEKVSDSLDGVFAQADFVTLVPSAAIVTLFGIKCYAIQILTYDPSGVKRPIIFFWDGKKWFSGSQGNNNMTLISTQQATSIENLWATDGTHIFQGFTTASANLNKTFSGKLWSSPNFIITNQALRLGIFTIDNAATVYTFTLSVDNENGSVPITLSGNTSFTWYNQGGTTFSWTNGSGNTFTWVDIGDEFTAADIVQYGRYLGVTFTTLAQDLTVIGVTLQHKEETAW
jgi:hypothetical protein